MKRYEKRVFWKFFVIYFASVSLLILSAGYFYYKEQKQVLLSKEQFSLILYARMLKMSDFRYKKDGYFYEILDKKIEKFEPRNLKITDCCIEKIVPNRYQQGFIVVKKSKEEFLNHKRKLIIKVLIIQVLLLLFFGVISFFLAKLAIKPLQETINRLSLFIKDLIHDLNTPVTFILLNLKLLNSYNECKDKKELVRIENSAKEIADLYKNLNILLEERTFKKEELNLYEIVKDVVEIIKTKYYDIRVGNRV
ncbi:ATP-binding protein [Nitrosophilus labii]|uniref:ATP-binding protein n=1 Tax=Nitrosophilus labii TaxID=2706014 RepID=UPI0016572A7C|nr:histidine kinase dimerization/phospho-acceptor domain-containing protein [Nitrosophilus labii]